MTVPDAFQLFLFLTTRYLAPQQVAAEWILVALAWIVLTSVAYRLPLAPVARAFHQIANRKRLAIALSFVAPIAIRLSLLGVMPVPVPSIHDEFSHLLLADTLAHGRLANPPHPLWRHFESIHILQQPHYASMYPPAQGMFLALGRVIFRHPWAGVLLSVGLLCAAVCWMLQGWFPPAWALFGTGLVALKLCLTGIFVDSYLGGAPAALGAALVVASLAPRRRSPWLFGTGLVLLMMSRPFEGSLLGLLSLSYLLFKRRLNTTFLLRAGGLVAAGLLFTGYYNFRVTGHPLQMPYMLNRDTYGWPENLAFLPPKKLAPLRHDPMEAMRQRELSNRSIYSTPQLFIENLDTKFFDNWVYFLGPLLTLPLCFYLSGSRRKKHRILLLLLAALLALNLLQMVLYPYHLGPAVPLIYALVLLGVRAAYVAMKRFHAPRARAVLLFLPLALLCVDAMKEFAPELRLPLSYWESGREPHQRARAEIERYLNTHSGRHLVIVHFEKNHSPSQEWVYNGADIDGGNIVWARDMASNADLLRYFSGRTIWLLNADRYPQHLVRYAEPQ